MPAFHSVRRVKHSAEDMFALVADVESYAEFVPYCWRSHVRSRSTDAGGVETLIADMGFGYGAIRQEFTTRDLLDARQRRISVNYTTGPFRRFENVWRFETDGEGCRVDFFTDYELASRTIAVLVGTLFEQVFHKMSAAFEARAGVLYPRRSNTAS